MREPKDEVKQLAMVPFNQHPEGGIGAIEMLAKQLFIRWRIHSSIVSLRHAMDTVHSAFVGLKQGYPALVKGGGRIGVPEALASTRSSEYDFDQARHKRGNEWPWEELMVFPSILHS